MIENATMKKVLFQTQRAAFHERFSLKRFSFPEEYLMRPVDVGTIPLTNHRLGDSTNRDRQQKEILQIPTVVSVTRHIEQDKRIATSRSRENK